MLRTLIVAAALALAACTGPAAPQFHSTDVTGANYGKSFALTDHHGQRRTLADFHGKVVTLFFGFTQCPDVCPTTLNTMREVMTQLGDDAERVQVLFVTVDSERDTEALLAHYVPAFDPRFLGLYGDADETAAMAKEFRIFYRKSGDTDGPNYSIDHSAGTYVFDPQGRLRLYVRHAETAENIAADLRILLSED
ncbi:MAG TPA: SCO family protein [Rhodocyclaceae bacterium]|nr:SCO family protein [Rhodocyclaceae bacterium]